MTETPRSNRFIIGLFILATLIAGFSFGAYQGLFSRSSAPTMTILRKATVLPEPMILPAFELVDDGGNSFGPEQLKGRWSLMFFGFASCAHVCPFTLSTLTEAATSLEEAPRIIFLSIDPGRDTPEVLARYVQGFGGDMIGVSGDDAEIRKLTSKLGVMYRVDPDPDAYVVEHSQAVFVLDPQGRYTAVITAADDAGLIAADLREIMDMS